MLYTLFLIIMLVVALAALLVLCSAFWGFLATRVPFVPTPAADIAFLAQALRLSPKDLVYDLGSGDGKVCLGLNRLTGARCVGFELTWWTYCLARLQTGLQVIKIRRRAAGAELSRGKAVSAVQFYRKNFFQHSWAEADYIYAYLYPPLMARVEKKFLAECRPGSRAVIRDFPFPNLVPEQKFIRPGRHEIFVYVK